MPWPIICVRFVLVNWDADACLAFVMVFKWLIQSMESVVWDACRVDQCLGQCLCGLQLSEEGYTVLSELFRQTVPCKACAIWDMSKVG